MNILCSVIRKIPRKTVQLTQFQFPSKAGDLAERVGGTSKSQK